MTNGEKFKEIFPDIQIKDANMEVNVYINHCLVTFPKEWWNKTYTKGGSFCVQKGCSAMTIDDKLGNAVNHELTIKFIQSDFDLSLVRPQELEVWE